MRYVIPNNLFHELKARQKYILDSLYLWIVIQTSNEDSAILTSIPSVSMDIFFIVGHNCFVYNYLRENAWKIPEKIIVAITCGNMPFSSINLPGKIFYICNQNRNKEAILLDGSDFNFKFDLTESELLFFNSKMWVSKVGYYSSDF